MEEVKQIVYISEGNGFVVEAQNDEISPKLCLLSDPGLTQQNKDDIDDFLVMCLSKSEAEEIKYVSYVRTENTIYVQYKGEYDDEIIVILKDVPEEEKSQDQLTAEKVGLICTNLINS